MTLDQLRYALELERTKNFSKAAEKCSITQPSLSVQISKLESELGVALFLRDRAGVKVTEYGVELLKQARNIVDEAERMTQIAFNIKGEVQGVFRLGIISTLAPSLLPLFIEQFGIQYPKVKLIITEDRTEFLVSAIDQGQIDGALLSTPLQCPDTLLEKVLFYEPFTVFASNSHPILKGKQVNVDQISADEILLLDDTHCLRDQVLQLCKAKKLNQTRSLTIESASLQTLIELIRHTQGYTMLPVLSLQLLTRSEQQKNVRSFEKPLPSRKVSLVFHQARLKERVAEALATVILAALPEEVFLSSSRSELKILAPSLEHFEI